MIAAPCMLEVESPRGAVLQARASCAAALLAQVHVFSRACIALSPPLFRSLGVAQVDRSLVHEASKRRA